MMDHISYNYEYLHGEDVRVFDFGPVEKNGDMFLRERIFCHAIHLPTGLEVMEKTGANFNHNQTSALVKLNEMVKSSNLRYYVGRTLSKRGSPATTFKVYSRGLRTRFDATVLMNNCADKDPIRKKDFFVFHKGV
jgi:hypothetical protein